MWCRRRRRRRWTDLLLFAAAVFSCCSPLQTGPDKTREYLVGLTRAIAEQPYRMQPSALAVVSKKKVNVKAAAAASAAAAGAAAGAASDAGEHASDDDDDGDDGAASSSAGGGKRKATGSSSVSSGGGTRTSKKSRTETWFAQLQMVPGVSAARASAIVAKYPTLRSLVNVYRDPSVPVVTKETLLEDVDIRLGKKTKLTKLSKEIFIFFTTLDPTVVLGSETGKV